MGTTSQQSEGSVSAVVSNEGLESGWDIVRLEVKGRSILPRGKGEFATEDEAYQAAFARGKASLKTDVPS